MFCLDCKKRYKRGEKYIAQSDFVKHFRKSEVSVNIKIYYA